MSASCAKSDAHIEKVEQELKQAKQVNVNLATDLKERTQVIFDYQKELDELSRKHKFYHDLVEHNTLNKLNKELAIERKAWEIHDRMMMPNDCSLSDYFRSKAGG
jgi:predicted nuclease with TOPRIM domain